MPAQPDDLFEILKKIRMDLSQLQARVTDLGHILAAMHLQTPRQFICPDPLCKLPFSSEERRAEHVYHTHGGPEPAHWQAAEALAAAETEAE